MQNASGQGKSSDGDGFPFHFIGVSQKVAFDGSVQSTALGLRTSVVRLTATQDCHVSTAAIALADGTAMFLPKGTIDHIAVAPGTKLAVIKDGTGGNLFITEGA